MADMAIGRSVWASHAAIDLVIGTAFAFCRSRKARRELSWQTD
jgi:hypothetical protein